MVGWAGSLEETTRGDGVAEKAAGERARVGGPDKGGARRRAGDADEEGSGMSVKAGRAPTSGNVAVASRASKTAA